MSAYGEDVGRRELEEIRRLYGEAAAAMGRAVEALVEARQAVNVIPGPDLLEDALRLERVSRRLENAAAQAELDRLTVVRVGQGEA